MVSDYYTFDHLLNLDLPTVFDRCSDGLFEICCDIPFGVKNLFYKKPSHWRVSFFLLWGNDFGEYDMTEW